MAQVTYPSEEITDGAKASRSFNDALDIRASARRARRHREILYLAIVAAGVLGALIYGLLIAPPRFSTETRFSVRASSQGSSSAAPATSLISTGANQGAAMGFVDGFAVNDFLKSRDCVRQLSRRLDLRLLLEQHYGATVHLQSGQSDEVLYREYQKAVSATFNMLEQVNVVRVSAFSPQASQQIASQLLALSQDFVSRMDSQGVADSLDVSTRQVRAAEEQDLAAAGAISQWRGRNRNMDPQAESGMIMQMISTIEQELTTAKINYEKVRAYENPDHPMLQPARLQVAALERQLAKARERLTGSGNSEATRLRTYEQLKNAQTFADSNLAAARNAYQQAFIETMRLRRYLTVIARPVAEDQPSSPQLGLLLVEGLLAGLLAAFVTSIAIGAIKARRT